MSSEGEDLATPVGAHAVARATLSDEDYAHTRGVAQQAARVARHLRLPAAARKRLLAAAWLHAVAAPQVTARRLAQAGHPDLAAIVAHRGFNAMAAHLRGDPSVEDEFSIPTGVDEQLLIALDAACVTTDRAGAPCGPATFLRHQATAHGGADPSVRAWVAVIARLGEDPATRALVDAVTPGPVR